MSMSLTSSRKIIPSWIIRGSTGVIISGTGTPNHDIGFLTTALAIYEPGSPHIRTWTCGYWAERVEGNTAFTCLPTSLYLSIALGCDGLVQHYLRAIGAGCVNASYGEDETTTLAIAARYGQNHAIHVLIGAGADVNTGWKHKTPLYEAVEYGKIESVTILLDDGASVDQLDPAGRNLLHLAARNDDSKMAELLITKGFNVNSTDDYSNTPLLACEEVYNSDDPFRPSDGVDLAAVQIGAGARLDMANNDGTTALMKAVKSMRWPLVKFLIEAGANTSLRNGEGESVLHMFLYSKEDERSAEKNIQGIG